MPTIDLSNKKNRPEKFLSVRAVDGEMTHTHTHTHTDGEQGLFSHLGRASITIYGHVVFLAFWAYFWSVFRTFFFVLYIFSCSIRERGAFCKRYTLRDKKRFLSEYFYLLLKDKY